jgi:glutathione S-transferase
MIRFYFHPTPNPAKVALFLEEAGLPYETIPVDTSKGEQHLPAFRAVNPNGKAPAIIDTQGPGGGEARVFDSSAILLYLGEKTGRFLGAAADRPELLSWLFFIGSGLGPFSGQAVHFQHAAPEKLPYAINRYRREAERHYRVLDERLAARAFILGDAYFDSRYVRLGLARSRWPRSAGRGPSPRLLPESQALVRNRGCPPSRRPCASGRQGSHLQARGRRRDAARALSLELSACGVIRRVPSKSSAPSSNQGTYT